MNICVVGLGVIGLPQAYLLSENKKNDVVGYDINKKKMMSIYYNAKELLGIDKVNFKTVNQLPKTDNYIVCVPTPLNKNREADISAVESAVSAIIKVADEGSMILIESTVPVGTVRKLKNKSKKGMLWAYCPERVLPGKDLLNELISNRRIIGADTDEEFKRAFEIYSSFVKSDIVRASFEEAELVKLVENTSRDIQISFANELSRYCMETGIDVWRIIEMANMHPRVNILSPGVGVGGHCIAVDPVFLINSGKFDVAKTARRVNFKRVNYWKWFALDIIRDRPEINNVIVIGAAYKKDDSSTVNSPALLLADFIGGHKFDGQDRVINVNVWDPNVEKYSSEMAIDGADMAIFAVDHEYFSINAGLLKELLGSKMSYNRIIIDCCGAVSRSFYGEEFEIYGMPRQ